MLTKDQILQDRYQLQRLLGNNAGRQTWLAEDRQTHTPVVVKLLAFSPQMQWDDLELFEREAIVLQQLNYPRIPHYLNYFSINKEAGGGLCWFGLVQAAIPGLSLEARLKQGERFTVQQIQAIATQVLEILVYLHGQEPPVLHRDIKPSNLLLDQTGQVYLVDFGAVQNRAAVAGMTFTIVGTTGYAPLEQFWGRAVPASDLYALGATLIHLVTGVAPADLAQCNLRIQFRDRISLDPEFMTWIEALTEPDLEHRYQTAQQALTDLQTGQSLRSTLRVIQSPVSNRIRLERSLQQFQVEIRGWRQLLFLPQDLLMVGIKSILALGGLVSLGLLLVGLVVGTVRILSSTFSIGAEMLLLLLLGSGFAVVGYQCMQALETEIETIKADLRRSPPPCFALGSYSLHIDKDRFTITWKLFGFRIRQWQGRTANIKAVTGDRGTITIKHLTTAYKLGYRLSPTESRWLVDEITTWLKQ